MYQHTYWVYTSKATLTNNGVGYDTQRGACIAASHMSRDNPRETYTVYGFTNIGEDVAMRKIKVYKSSLKDMGAHA